MKKYFITLFLIFSIFSLGENIRKISVTGNSEREILPDIATISFKITSENKDLNIATNELNKKIENFKKQLKENNINLENFETTSFYNKKQRNFDYQYDLLNTKINDTNLNNNKPNSYNTSLSFLIKENDYNKISNIIDILNENNIQNISKLPEKFFTFSLEENEDSMDKSIQKVIEKFNNIKNKLESNGISSKNINLGDYTIEEIYTPLENNLSDTYTVTEEFKIKTKNINDINTIISIAEDNNINTDSFIDFDISNKKEIISELYNEAYNQAKTKANSILKSSNLELKNPIMISEDINFQDKMIERIDSQWKISNPQELNFESSITNFGMVKASLRSVPETKIDYKPKPIKISQDLSILYEIK